MNCFCRLGRNCIWDKLRSVRIFVGFLAWVGAWTTPVVSQEDQPELDLSQQLPRFAPQSTEQALSTFTLQDGFQMELVAAEPLVMDPVAFAFDASERLWVVEMRGYSEQPDENLGRIALLQDVDRDGRMDRRSTFVEGLSWPTAVWPWRDGVLVAEPPRLTWYRDTDGDGMSDWSQDWFQGFGKSNVQGMVNSLRWNIDGYLHGATSSSGASIRRASSENSAQLALRGRDFRIDTLEKLLWPVSGGGQHGLCFNRWGDKFVTSNSDHLQQVIDCDGWLAKHSTRVALPRLRRSIAEDGPQAAVYRTSPIEPWRIVRTRLRVGGVVPGVVEGGGRPAGYFTGATGTWIMPSETEYGVPAKDTALVCDVGGNLIHRKRMVDQGMYWSADRIDNESELLTSTDTWFRPVQLSDGPDGALYIADMYREVIEHPKSLPPMIKRHLDLTSGRDRGRIWRLTSSKLKSTQRKQYQPISDMPPSELIEELESHISWRRLTAGQRLVEEGVQGEAGLLLSLMHREAAKPESRILALHVANRLEVLEVDSVRGLLQDTHARVLEHAIQIVERRGWGSALREQLTALAEHPSPRIRLALARLCAELPAELRVQLGRRLFFSEKDALVRAVLAVSLSGAVADLMMDPESERIADDDYREWLKICLPNWVGRVLTDADLKTWIERELCAAENPRQKIWLDVVSSLGSRAEREKILSACSPGARADLEKSVLTRLDLKHLHPQQCQWLGLLSTRQRQVWLERLLDPTVPSALQRAAVQLVDLSREPEFAELLLGRLDRLDERAQQSALQVMLQHVPTCLRLLREARAGRLAIDLFSMETRARLKRHRSQEIQVLAQEAFGDVESDRSALVAKYERFLQANWTESPDDDVLVRGREHFRKVCSQCHQLENIGQDVGAPLTQLFAKSPSQILGSILDPNREVDPRYVAFSVLLDDDRVLAGVIRYESANEVQLVSSGGKSHAIPRESILRLSSSGNSLMPIGIEAQLTREQMVELIAYLRSIR